MSNVTRIKICGITNEEDTRVAVAYGADALGLNFVKESPRYIGQTPDLLAILRQIPPFVSRVAVCMNIETVPGDYRPFFDTVQFYAADQPPDACPEKRLVQAFRIRDEGSLDVIAASLSQFRPHALLLDAWHKDKLGGSGETFNWDLAREAKARFGLPILLAGGLTPENVGQAIATVRPYAVDVSSGVEAEPGRKDHARLRAFIQAVRQADTTP